MEYKELKDEFENMFSNDERVLFYVDSDDPTQIDCGDRVWNWFESKLREEREKASKDFAIWFENNTGGLFRGEMEQKWNEYLSTIKEVRC